MYHCRAGMFQTVFCTDSLCYCFCFARASRWDTYPRSQQGQGPPSWTGEPRSSISGEHHRLKQEPNEHFGPFQPGFGAGGGRQELWRWGGTPQLDSGRDTWCQGGPAPAPCSHFLLGSSFLCELLKWFPYELVSVVLINQGLINY